MLLVVIKLGSLAMSATTTPGIATSSNRLESLDALRGFDMLWIAGGDFFGVAFDRLNGGVISKFLGYELKHTSWAGFTFEDLIFPLFVFIVGVSISLSITSLVNRVGHKEAIKHIVRRSLLMYLLGVFLYGGFTSGLEHMRLLGVLQRISICYLVTSLLFMYLKPRYLIITFITILIGYWAIMKLIPVPGIGVGNFEEGKNLANWVDKQWLPGRLWNKDHDPEGILSTIPAIATCLFGVCAGMYLKSVRTEKVKLWTMFLGGIACVIIGFVWGMYFPVIKKIWTSSFVLVSGGYSLALLGVFYYLIDGLNIKTWATPFKWIGANALTIYVLTNIVSFHTLCSRFVGGLVSHQLNSLWTGLGDLTLALFNAMLCVLIARFLYKRNIFLRL